MGQKMNRWFGRVDVWRGILGLSTLWRVVFLLFSIFHWQMEFCGHFLADVWFSSYYPIRGTIAPRDSSSNVLEFVTLLYLRRYLLFSCSRVLIRGRKRLLTVPASKFPAANKVIRATKKNCFQKKLLISAP